MPPDVPEAAARPVASRVAAAVVLLRWPLVLAWIAGAAALTVLLPSFTSTGGAAQPPIPSDVPSRQAEAAAAQRFGSTLLARVLVVQRDAGGLGADRIARSAELAARVTRQQEPGFDEVAAAVPVVNVPGLSSRGESLTTMATGLFFRQGTSIPLSMTLAARYAERLGPGAAVVGATGSIPALDMEDATVREWIPWVTAATIAVIALVLGLALRSPVAPLVALAAVAVAYLVDVRVIASAADALGLDTPREAEPVVVALLFAVVTDYAAFFMFRTRRLLAEGVPARTAARRAATSVAPVVAAAGLIVAAGTATVLVSGLDFFRAFGPALAISGIVGAAVAVTLVPALLAVLGRRAFWPGTATGGGRGAAGAGAVPRLLARPGPAAAAAVVVTAGLVAAAVLGLGRAHLGFSGPGGLPSDSPPARAADAASAGFAPGIVAPTEIDVSAPGIAADRPALLALQDLVAREPGVAAVLGAGTPAASRLPAGVVTSPDGSAARMLVILDRDPFSPAAVDALGRIGERMPGLLERAGLEGATSAMSGDTALAEDTIGLMERDLRRVGLVCLGVVLLLMMLVLRSVVTPVVVLAATALGFAATLGLTSLVTGPVLGSEAIVYFVPLAASVLLVSLGSDYSVFLVGRVWERAHDRPVRAALGTAVTQASGAISVAGLVLALSFAVLWMVPLLSMRQFAFTMAVGVLLDAFLVRSLLLPATLGMLGERARWPRRPRTAGGAAAPTRPR